MELSKKQCENSLKSKKIMLASWGCKIITSQECRDWQPIFKKIFKKVLIFSLKNQYYHYGSEELNKNFLYLIKKEKPDFLFVCPAYDELTIESLVNMKKINPSMKTIIWFGDDEFRFDDWSRYYSLFFDYILTTKKELQLYLKDGIKNVSFMIGVNSSYHKPLKTKKIYDVTFIGAPLKDRYDYIKFLKDKKIKITLFGGGWDKLDLNEIYKGFLSPEDFIKVINQTKINLNFSKTFFKIGDKGQMKGRPIEILACKSFVLNEYTPRTINYITNKKEINFRSKEELLEKIKYYLKNEQERENLALEGYNHVIKNYVWEDLFLKYFQRINKDSTLNKKLPLLNKSISEITDKEIMLPLKNLRESLNNIDYVYFTKPPFKVSSHKNFLLAYSLKVSGKQISLCDYSVYSNLLGKYLSFYSKKAFFSLKPKDFSKFLNPNQIMVSKDYFLKNINDFKKFFFGDLLNISNEQEIIFVSIPLVSIPNPPLINYKKMPEIIKPLFFDKIFTLFFQNKIFNLYILKFLLFKSNAKSFMWDYLFRRLGNLGNWKRINIF